MKPALPGELNPVTTSKFTDRLVYGFDWIAPVDPVSRRPSGQPIEEETEPEAPAQESPTEPGHDQAATRWAYSALGDDNDVWSK